MLAGLAVPGQARDRSETIRVAAAGSGAYAGYERPDLVRRMAAAARTYPGYGAVTPGVQPGYAAPAPRRTTGGLFGYLANRNRAAVVAAPAPVAEPVPLRRAQRSAGLIGRSPAPVGKAVAQRGFDPTFLPQEVAYSGSERPGTLVIDTNARFLYLVGDNGTARRYGVGVGKPGFEWAGRHTVTRKSEWPTWTPPSQMRERERQKGRILPVRMDGGPENPLGARALYLGSTLYRIHGTNQPWSIGKAVSSGCIRMRNEDVTDLYERVGVGTSVIVL